MKIQVTSTPFCNVRAGPSTARAIIATLPTGTIVDADQASVADWWALTLQEAYVHKSVASLYIPPTPLPNGVIPYFSQEDQDAKHRNNDCGPACVKMVLASKGYTVKIDDIWEPDPTGLSNGYDLVHNFAKYGLTAQVQSLDEGKLPPQGAICLIWDGAIDRAYVQAKKFTGLHWVVWLYQDNTVEDFAVVHDPNFYGDSRQWGSYHHIPIAQWEKAFTQCDPSRQMVVLV